MRVPPDYSGGERAGKLFGKSESGKDPDQECLMEHVKAI
jgi:hypothetical protein